MVAFFLCKTGVGMWSCERLHTQQVWSAIVSWPNTFPCIKHERPWLYLHWDVTLTLVFRSPSLATAFWVCTCCLFSSVLPLLHSSTSPPLHVWRRCLWNQAHMGEVSRSFTKEELLCGFAHIWDWYQLPNREPVYSWSIESYGYAFALR